MHELTTEAYALLLPLLLLMLGGGLLMIAAGRFRSNRWKVASFLILALLAVALSGTLILL